MAIMPKATNAQNEKYRSFLLQQVPLLKISKA
jgi:hypothetical protein